MTDRVRFEQLILAHHPCVTISTPDEAYVLVLLREIAVEARREMWQWSFTNGLGDALLSDSPTIADSEHPAGALYYLINNVRSEEHTSELQSRQYLVCLLLLEKKQLTLTIANASARCLVTTY